MFLMLRSLFTPPEKSFSAFFLARWAPLIRCGSRPFDGTPRLVMMKRAGPASSRSHHSRRGGRGRPRDAEFALAPAFGPTPRRRYLERIGRRCAAGVVGHQIRSSLWSSVNWPWGEFETSGPMRARASNVIPSVQGIQRGKETAQPQDPHGSPGASVVFGSSTINTRDFRFGSRLCENVGWVRISID